MMGQQQLSKKGNDVYLLDFLKDLGIKRLSATGENIQGLCPLHNEHRRSWGIHSETGKWNCFGCGAKGDLAILVSRIKNIDIEDAKRYLRSPEFLKFKINNLRDIKKENRLIKIPYGFSIVNEFNCPNYLKDRISINAIKHFKIGICSDERYKDYAIIPICESSKIVGFVARCLHNNTEFKYLYPTGMVKKSFLFNFDEILANKFSKLILVEGAFDVMGCYDKGLTNVAAIFGAHELSDVQLAKIMGLDGIKEIILALDSDTAGTKATKKIYDQLSGICTVTRLCLPKGKDIDELTKEELYNVLKMRRHYINIGGFKKWQGRDS